MRITRQMVADRFIAYLHHKLSQEELVNWAEQVMQEEDFEEKDYEDLRDVISRLGLADVKAFGLMWEDCEQILRQLGYTIYVEVAVQEAQA